MAYADPQTVTVNSVAQTLARLGMGPSSGTFAKDDGSYKLLLSHAVRGGRNQRLIRLENYKTATDPLVPTQNAPYNMSAHLVVNVPKVGYTIAEQSLAVQGFLAYLSASSYAVVTKLLGGEV